jgi:hypothetical protein
VSDGVARPAAGPWVAVVGCALLVISGIMDWLDGDPGVSGYDVPAKFLVDVKVTDEGLSIGFVLAVLAAVGVFGALAPAFHALTVAAGIGALVVVVMFVYQLGEFADLANQDPLVGGSYDRFDLVGFGTWVAAIGGITTVVGSALARPRQRIG